MEPHLPELPEEAIAAIKALRAERKLGLAEAKAVVDAVLRARGK